MKLECERGEATMVPKYKSLYEHFFFLFSFYLSHLHFMQSGLKARFVYSLVFCKEQ